MYRHIRPYLTVQTATIAVVFVLAILGRHPPIQAQMNTYQVPPAQAFADAIKNAEDHAYEQQHLKSIDEFIADQKAWNKTMWEQQRSNTAAISGFSALQSNGLTIIGIMNAAGIGVAVQTARKRRPSAGS